MKLNRDTQEETLVIGAEKEQKFSIDTDNGVIFDILRDKMYSNKIGSIVREVASNSRDANRESGNGDKDISLIITQQYSELLPDQYCMVFRDLGPGISEDRMANVFLKYAASTKRHTNAQTGGFGLGAKTPFAYTDSWYMHTVAYTTRLVADCETGGLFGSGEDTKIEMVEKRVKVSYFYNGLVDETGVGKMILLESEIVEDDRPTGTDIILPLNDASDKQKFADECMYYTSLWDNVDYQGVKEASSKSFYRSNIVIDTPTYMVVKKEDWDSPFNSGVYAMVDGIPYPVGDREHKEIQQIHKGLSNHTLFLKFNTGEVSVSATRESIEFNEKTLEAISRVFRRSISSIVKEFQTELNKLTYIEGMRNIIAIFNRQKELFQESSLLESYNGTLIKTIYDHMEDFKLERKVKFHGQTVKKIIDVVGEGKIFSLLGKFELLSVSKSDASKYNDPKSKNLLSYGDVPIYIMDSRKDRRKNFTILEKSDRFLLIRPFGRSVEQPLTSGQYDIFSKMIFEYDIDVKLYSEVEKKELEEHEKGEVYIPGETVSTRFRKYTEQHDSDPGVSKVVEVNRKDGTYKEFMNEDDFLIVTDKLSDFKLRYNVRDLAYQADCNLWVTTEKTHQRYYKNKPFVKLEDLEDMRAILKERRYERMMRGVDKELLLQACIFHKSVREYCRDSSVAITTWGSSMKQVNFILLGLFDKRVASFSRIVFKTNPTEELAVFLKNHRSVVQTLYKELTVDQRLYNFDKKGTRGLKKIVEKLMDKVKKRSILVEEVLFGYSEVSKVRKVAKELELLKQL